MDQVLVFIATGFYSDMPLAALSILACLSALLLWLLCKNFSLSLIICLTAGLFLLGCFAADFTERMFDQPDASPIVIDEILGIFITVAAAPKVRFYWLSGFLVFFFLDVLKPFPASWIDTYLKGGLAIMLDDIVAGVYSLLFLHLVRYLSVKGDAAETSR